MLSTIESRYATLKGLINGDAVSTKNSEHLWFTSRISNTISDLRNKYNYGFERIKTKIEQTAARKNYGVYVLDMVTQKDYELLEQFKNEVIEKYRDSPKLLEQYLGDGYEGGLKNVS